MKSVTVKTQENIIPRFINEKSSFNVNREGNLNSFNHYEVLKYNEN